MTTNLIAIDLGASSGRVTRGRLHGARIVVEEVHRFATPSKSRRNRLQWDWDALVSQIERGLVLANEEDGCMPASVGIDSWGVDYALIDEAGDMLAPPFHYRDARTAGLAQSLDGEFLFARTGVAAQDINTLTQLLTEDAGVLGRAQTLLFVPDLVAHYLSGVRATDPTIASTSQLVSPAGAVDADILARFDLPDLLPAIRPSGSVLGGARRAVTDATGFRGAVTTIAGHDTASAVAAIPAADSPVAFVSCGTWGLVGLELDHPVVSQEARRAGFTNEIGFRSHHLLRNASGLWLLNECLREWSAPANVSIPSLTEAAATLPAFRSIVDPLDPVFVPPGDMTGRIAAYCGGSGQPAPRSPAEFVRCVLDSLALGFADTILEASHLAGANPTTIHVVGGGSRIRLLCATIAALTGTPVVAGPAEATVYGNLLIQAHALGLVDSSKTLRQIVAASVSTTTFPPERVGGSDEALRAYHDLVALRGQAS